MPTNLDLSGVYAKMAWARIHFQTLDVEIAKWLVDDAHRVIYERNEDLTQHYLRAEFGAKPRIDRWPLMVGDCVTNLRDTLDHLIYAIAHLPESPLPAKADSAAFIIRDKPENFTKDARSRLCSVPDSVRDAVLSFQPFNRPHAVLPPLLSILSELANGSKHKLLDFIFTAPENLAANFVSHGGVHYESVRFAVNRAGIVEGVPFLVVETPAPDPNFRFDGGRVDFGIAIAHKPLPGDTRYDAAHTSYRILLQTLFDEVEHIVNTIQVLV